MQPSHLATCSSLFFVLLVGCNSQPDDSIYVDTGEKLLGKFEVSAAADRIVHFGIRYDPSEGRRPAMVRVVDGSLKTVFYWQNRRFWPRCAALSPDGAFLVVSCSPFLGSGVNVQEPNSFFVVDLNKKEKHVETVGADGVSALAFSSDGRMLATAWYRGLYWHLRLYEFPSMKELRRSNPAELEPEIDNKRRSKLIEHIGFVDADRKIVTVAFQGLIEVFETKSLQSGGFVESAPDEKPFVHELERGEMTWVPSTRQVLIQGKDLAVHQFDPKKVAITASLNPFTKWGGMKQIPHSDYIFVYGPAQTKELKRREFRFRIWDPARQKFLTEENRLGPQQKEPSQYAFLPDGKRVVSLEDGELKIRDMGEIMPKAKEFLFPRDNKKK